MIEGYKMSEDEIKPVVKKVCKHCGTENLEDFIKKNGKDHGLIFVLNVIVII